jgi:hypothetical protein
MFYKVNNKPNDKTLIIHNKLLFLIKIDKNYLI